MRFIFQRIGINLQIPLIVPARRKFEGHLIALHLRQPSAEVVNDPREGNFVRSDRSSHHFLGDNGVGVDFWHGAANLFSSWTKQTYTGKKKLGRSTNFEPDSSSELLST
uniref:(northern house mosquito) hypothetical protein n=1 Tax=Culex pipiens TaxID=7175 RepID=A0A8D8BMN1_CULPI